MPHLLAPKLMRIRERLRVGQAEMARLLGDTPIPPDGGTVSRFERGEREPNLLEIVAYCNMAQIDASVLIDDRWTVKDLVSQTLGEKLKQIREHSKLSPNEFAPHVKAKHGAEILSYENNTGELPVTILIRYARLVNLPLENLVDDDLDLWLGHRVNEKFTANKRRTI